MVARYRKIPVSEVVNVPSLRMLLSAWLDYLSRHKRQIARFIIVGASTFLLYFLLFHVLYGSAGLGYKVAITIAYAVTVFCHFLLNRFFTFSAQHRNLGLHAGRYGLMLVLNYLTTLFVMWVVVEIIRTSPYVGAVASTIVTATSSFFVMKHFVFSLSEVRG
jgi:putative flippase GtrA